jgi:hypothetical protein
MVQKQLQHSHPEFRRICAREKWSMVERMGEVDGWLGAWQGTNASL